MKKLLLSIMSIMNITAQAQDKILIGGSTDGAKIYIYPSSISRYSNYLKVWEEWKYTNSQYDRYENKYYNLVKTLTLVDCNLIRSFPIASISYSAYGDVVSQSRVDEWVAVERLDYAPPGSITRGVIETTCKYYDRY